jgi:hypothetical protein
MSSHARHLVHALAAAALVAGCRVSPEPPPEATSNESLVIGRLAQVNPRDIVVMPVVNTTGRADVPLEELRRAFQAGLVLRRYSPLSLEFVDSRLDYAAAEGSDTVEATYPIGSLEEEGVLQIAIHVWDTSAWRSHSRLEIQADVHLLDAGEFANGEALWGGPVKRTIDLDDAPRVMVNERQRVEHAVQMFASGVLAALPPRDPRPTAAPR